MVANSSSNGLRFHDLRHSYATWLVTNGVPDIYTHTPDDYERARSRPSRTLLYPEADGAEEDGEA